MAAANKTSNSYADMIANFDAIPKAVLAAIAVSYYINLGNIEPEGVTDAIMEEWATLHNQGIVPQKPVKIKTHDTRK